MTMFEFSLDLFFVAESTGEMTDAKWWEFLLMTPNFS